MTGTATLHSSLLEDGAGIVKVITRTEVQEGDHVTSLRACSAAAAKAGAFKSTMKSTPRLVRPVNRLTPDLVG